MNSAKQEKKIVKSSAKLTMVQLVEALRCKPEGRGFDTRWGHFDFSLTLSFQPHCGSGVDSTSNRNKDQEYLLGVKAKVYTLGVKC